MHYRKAIESLLLCDFTCYLGTDDYPIERRWVEINLRARVAYSPTGRAVIEALEQQMRNHTPMEHITAADLGLVERLAVARDTIAMATPEQLAELAVCVDAAISGRGMAEYRSPADVARIAELEGS